ncbi:methyl-accepting chemotaxis protein [Larsenimonas suaedae]|nr:methyl-accepting chemotaxis protein [Larsenimonas suaedae]
MAFLVVLLVAIGSLGLFSASSGQEDLRESYEESLIPIRALGSVRANLLMNRTQVTTALLLNDASAVPAIRQTMTGLAERVDEQWTTYLSSGTPAPEERAGIDAFQKELPELRASLDRAMTLAAAGNFDGARSLLDTELEGEYSAIIEQLTDLIVINERLAAENFVDSKESYATLRTLSVAAMVLSIISAIALAFWLVRGIITPLSKARDFATELAEGNLNARINVTCKDEFGQMLDALVDMRNRLTGVVTTVRSSVEGVSLGSQEISSGNDDLNRRTQEQAASLEQTAASMDEMTSTVRQNAENASIANTLVGEVSNTAHDGGNVAQQAVAAMADINASSQQISGIISLIDEIAFQTNLLALNAAVEAARAGEQGRGFAVVAGEVRTLASRSADAAKEIKQLVDQSVDRVEAGSRLVNQAGESLGEIVEGVKRVQSLVTEIAHASREQSQGIEQINTAISQMDNVTQQNASLVEESSAASQSLNDQARSLMEQIAFFKLDGEGAHRAMASSAPAPRARTTASTQTSNVTRVDEPKSAKTAPRQAARAETATADDDWTTF